MMTIRDVVDRALRTRVLTRDQRAAIDHIADRGELADDELHALHSLEAALASRTILTYPDLCL